MTVYYANLTHTVGIGGIIGIDPNPGSVVTLVESVSGNTNAMPALSTSRPNDLIIVDVSLKPEGNVSAISVSSPTIGSFTECAFETYTFYGWGLFRFAAAAPTILTNEVITISLGSPEISGSEMSAIAYAISNANTSIPEGAVTGINGGGGVDPLSFTTTSPVEMIIATYRENTVANPTGCAGFGWTQIGASGASNFLLTEYKVVNPGTFSVTQSGAAANNAVVGIINGIVGLSQKGGMNLSKAAHPQPKSHHSSVKGALPAKQAHKNELSHVVATDFSRGKGPIPVKGAFEVSVGLVEIDKIVNKNRLDG